VAYGLGYRHCCCGEEGMIERCWHCLMRFDGRMMLISLLNVPFDLW
jgi:hypothetical protein